MLDIFPWRSNETLKLTNGDVLEDWFKIESVFKEYSLILTIMLLQLIFENYSLLTTYNNLLLEQAR